MRTVALMVPVALLAALAIPLLIPPATAHPVRPAIVTVTFHADDTYEAEIVLDPAALLSEIGAEHDDSATSPNAERYEALARLDADALRTRLAAFEDRFLDGVSIAFDGRRARPSVTGLSVPEGDEPGRLARIVLAGPIPAGARTFTWRYDAAFGTSALRVIDANGAPSPTMWLEAGAWSEPSRLGEASAAESSASVAARYVELGFVHILPEGLDHILFVLGIFLFSLRWRPLLVQVTAFTVAHSITLALALYGVVYLPASVVEPLIALSIVYVAIENIVARELKPWRVYLVFGFGLLHGLGFAGVLTALGVPREDFVTALIAFNVGVELGQLAVVGLAFLAVGAWFGRRAWYRSVVVVPASAAISLVGAFWTVQRILP